MKLKRFLALLLAIGLLAAPPAFASVGTRSSAASGEGNDTGAVADIMTGGTRSGSLLKLQGEQHIDLPLGGVLANKGNGVMAVQNNTTPAALRDSSGRSYLSWETDLAEHKAETQFVVPDDYVSGGAFKVMLGRSGRTTAPPSIDYEVIVTRSKTAPVGPTNQSVVTMSQTTGPDHPEETTLAVATDFADLDPGDVVTFKFWRDAADSSTEALKVYHVKWYYTAQEA